MKKQATARGSGEYERYYEVIGQIPAGMVGTYGDVARWAGKPGAARRVGYALAALPRERAEEVPWWRVINARGEVSMRSGDVLGACEVHQRAKLLGEGVGLDSEGRVDLARHRAAREADEKPRRVLLATE